jgi:hypothetical protein
LEVSVQNITQLVGHADFLHPFIWIHVSGLMQFRDASDKGTASNFVPTSKSVSETLAMTRQAFREESLRHKRLFEWLVQTYQDQKM